MSCWATLVPPWRLHPIDARGRGLTSWTSGSQGYNQQENTSSPCPPAPHSVPVQGHHATVLQGQEHHGGWGIYRCCPKIEIELQSGEDRGDLAGAVWSRKTVWDRVEDRLESRGGWLGTHLPTVGNWRTWDSGTGVGQHLRPQVNLSLLQAPPRMGRHWWGADREPLLGQGLVLGA